MKNENNNSTQMNTILIVISCLLLAGLFFSIRAIVLRRHIGCGIAGIAGILAPFVLLYLIISPPINFHKDLYRSVIGLEYPSSAKVIAKDCSNGWIDYDKALQAVQADSSFRLITDIDCWIPGGIGQSAIEEAGINIVQIEHLYEKGDSHRQIAGFHSNKQIIIVEKFRN
jgi:hypothetical protein